MPRLTLHDRVIIGKIGTCWYLDDEEEDKIGHCIIGCKEVVNAMSVNQL